VDFVSLDEKRKAVSLVMVEAREWGDQGRLLSELQEKFNTYLTYVTEGQLASDYPQVVDLRPNRVAELDATR